MNILYIGDLYYGSTCLMRMNALKSLGHNITSINILPRKSKLDKFIDRINYRLSYKLDFDNLNKKILNEFSKQNYDLIWIDKGTRIFSKTLNSIKQRCPSIIIAHINPDDPYGKFRTGWKTFIKAIPNYDIHFVAREVNVPEYYHDGAKKVYIYDRSFDPDIHKPIELNEEEKKKYSCKVGFIGSWAKDREKSIAFLIDNKIDVVIWGNDWEKGKYWRKIKEHYRGPGLNGIEYAKAINGMEIALHYLRKENRDEQDNRTFEIPACGTFMLAEKTKKHEELFKDGEETVLFKDDPDLLNKVKYYLNNDLERKNIAKSAFLRSVNSGYTHKERLKKLLEIINLTSRDN